MGAATSLRYVGHVVIPDAIPIVGVIADSAFTSITKLVEDHASRGNRFTFHVEDVYEDATRRCGIDIPFVLL